jgi:MoxR-like ATPase
MNQKLTYTGKKLPIRKDEETGETIYPYIPAKDLIQAVNLAIYLKRPLLLEGQPGGGKTTLARAVADELGLPYREFNVKSTSQGRDLKYQYDAIGRLRDAQLIANLDQEEARKLIEEETENYRTFEALGKAFKESQDKKTRTVILIDEIDKADLDFPNDLLQELDQKKFYIKETLETIIADPNYPPIIFITSNGTKKLSNPFLRRCLYYYVKFPSNEQLLEIIDSRYHENEEKLSAELIEKAVNKFRELYEDMLESQDERESNKLVSTSELLDWIEVMKAHDNKQKLIEQLDNDELPFPEVLLKSKVDRERYLVEENDEDED